MKKLVNKPWFYITLSFFVAFGIRLLFLPRVHTMSITGDEIFSFWPAAKMAGYDWQGVMNTYRYYGFGYSLLLYPFFLIFKDPVVLYRAMVVFMMICQSLVAPISFHLLKRYFHIKKNGVLFFGSVACAFLVSVRAVYTYPEFVYDLMVWLCVWILLKLLHTENAWKKAGFTFLLLICIGYAYSVHARGITLIAGLLFATIFFVWIYRKCPVSFPVLIAAAVVGVIGVRWGMNYLLTNLGYNSGTAVGNTVAVGGLGGVIHSFKEPEIWTGFINIIMGQLNEAIANTTGLAIFIVIAMLVLLWKGLFRKKEILDEQYKPYILIASFCLMCVIITIGGMGIKVASSVAWTMQHHGNKDAYRQIVYFRYYAAYIGPLLMLGIAYFAHKKELLNDWKNKALLIFALLQGYWIFCIVPLVYDYTQCSWSYGQYAFAQGLYGQARARTYLIGSFVLFVLFFVFYALIAKKKWNWILPLFCGVLIYSYSYNAIFNESARGEVNWDETKNGIAFLESLQKEKGVEEADIMLYYLPTGGQATQFVYQYHMPEIKLNELKEGTLSNRDVVIGIDRNSLEERTNSKEYQYYEFGESEVIGLKTKELQTFAKEYGLQPLK